MAALNCYPDAVEDVVAVRAQDLVDGAHLRPVVGDDGGAIDDRTPADGIVIGHASMVDVMPPQP